MKVLSTTEMRKQENSIKEQFADLGEKAPVIAVGAHRKAEMILMSPALYAQIEKLLNLHEDLEIARIIQERTSSATEGMGRSLEEVAKELNIDLKNL